MIRGGWAESFASWSLPAWSSRTSASFCCACLRCWLWAISEVRIISDPLHHFRIYHIVRHIISIASDFKRVCLLQSHNLLGQREICPSQSDAWIVIRTSNTSHILLQPLSSLRSPIFSDAKCFHRSSKMIPSRKSRRRKIVVEKWW